VNDEMKRIWQEAVVVYSRYSLESFKKGMKRTMKTARKSRCLVRDSKSVPLDSRL